MGDGIHISSSFWAARCMQSFVPMECGQWAFVDLLRSLFFLESLENTPAVGSLASGQGQLQKCCQELQSLPTTKPSLASLFDSVDHPSFRALGSFIMGPDHFYPYSVTWGSFWGAGFITQALAGDHSDKRELLWEAQWHFTLPPPPALSRMGLSRRPYFPRFICQYLWKSFSGESSWHKRTKKASPFGKEKKKSYIWYSL